jgi:hypothetical protein
MSYTTQMQLFMKSFIPVFLLVEGGEHALEGGRALEPQGSINEPQGT